MKTRICIAFTFVIVLAGCETFWTSKKTPLQDILSKYNYAELIPPSDNVSPGTIVRDYGKGGLHTVCSAKEAYGQDWINNIEVSKTIIRESQEQSLSSARLEAYYLSMLKAGGGGENVESVQVSITNARTRSISSVAASSKAPNPVCYSTVLSQTAIPKNSPLDLVTSVFVADVEYKVVFKRGVELSAEAQTATLKAFQLKLGAQSYVQGTDSIKGDGLVWGVRRDATSLEHYKNANK